MALAGERKRLAGAVSLLLIDPERNQSERDRGAAARDDGASSRPVDTG